MRNVLNKAEYGINVLLQGEYIRFDAREIKPLPTNLVESPDFARHTMLMDIGISQEVPIQSEIKSQESPAVPEEIVVDNKLVEAEVLSDTEIEKVGKSKRKGRN